MNKILPKPVNENSLFVSLVTQPVFLIVFTVISLLVIVLFGSFVYFYYPYSGMEISWDTNFGRVSAVYLNSPADQAGVLEGDWLLSIDGKKLEQWSNSPIYRFGIHAGDVVVYEFQRGQDVLSIPITIGGYFDNWNWYWYSFLIHFLAISFWILGAVMCLFGSHNDVCSRLLGVGFLMAGMTAAVGLAGGFNSFWGANDLGIIFRTWLGPIYVAAHLTFPTISLPKYRRKIINIFVIIATILTIFVMMNVLVSNSEEFLLTALSNMDLRRTAQVFFFFSWLMGTCLLVYNRIYSKNADVKRQTAIVLWGSLLGFAPFFTFVILPYLLFHEQFAVSLVSLVFLLLVPLSYIYVINRRKLLRVDLVVNRFVVLFALILLILSSSFLLFGAFTLVFGLSPDLPFVGGILATLIVLPSATIQRYVQIKVNRILYGSHYDFSTVTAGFSSRLAVTLDRETLFDLLTKDLSTQMGIRQTALFLVDGRDMVLQPADVSNITIPIDDNVCQHLQDVCNPVRCQYLWSFVSDMDQKRWQKFEWGELFVPMVFEGKLQGLLILGQRVIADLYSESDIQIIATIAYQGALAFANVQLVETLRGLTRRLVRSDENQRRKVARDLHDAVLQDLFFVRQQLLSDQEELKIHISNVIDQLRQTIKTQRTTLLDQGLELALESLVRDMQSLSWEETQIVWNNKLDKKINLNDEKSTSIYRIVQEAITNSLKHARAKHIYVKIEKNPKEVLMVSIEDDGDGMMELEWSNIGEHHYGLIGMKERALMIGADLNVSTEIGEGTTVLLEMKL